MSANETNKVFKTELIENSLVALKGLKRNPKSKIKVKYEYFGSKKEMITNQFFIAKTGVLCYADRCNAAKGFRVPFHPLDILEVSIIEKQEPTMTKEQFEAKFDKRFISEEKINEIYNDYKNGKDGCTLREHFRRIPPKGKNLLKKFLVNFKGLGLVGDNYQKSNYGDYYCTKVYDWSYNSKRGRDISISHQTNIDLVYYSSEFVGCGNGDYYILVNEKEVFFMERD